MKATFKRTDSGVNISLAGLTQGKALALCHAIRFYAGRSSVCEDILISLNHAIQKHGSGDEDQELFEATKSLF